MVVASISLNQIRKGTRLITLGRRKEWLLMRIKDIGEIGLIKRLARQARYDRTVIKGIGDDTAVIRWTKDKYLLYTCDISIEDVHFRLKDATPYQIGHKALGRNISDIAAMGGLARYAVVSVGINPRTPVSFVDGLYKGMAVLAKKFKLNIVGGDTSRSEKLVVDVSLIGEVEKKNLALRSGAKKGDVILVTGAVGGSIKGRHLDFTPRLEEARALVNNFKINSMIDVSDGLVLDLWRILDASRAGARIYKSLVPVSKKADSFEKAVTDGEDFELLFTMSPQEAKRLFKYWFDRMKTPVTLIGEVLDKKAGYRLVTEDGKEKKLRPEGYLHF